MLTAWKSLIQSKQGLVTGYHLPFQQNERRGLLVTVPPMATTAAAAVKKARESSLHIGVLIGPCKRLFTYDRIHRT
jgi:hypothetical protein